jgi:hypothetical protein
MDPCRVCVLDFLAGAEPGAEFCRCLCGCDCCCRPPDGGALEVLGRRLGAVLLLLSWAGGASLLESLRLKPDADADAVERVDWFLLSALACSRASTLALKRLAACISRMPEERSSSSPMSVPRILAIHPWKVEGLR